MKIRDYFKALFKSLFILAVYSIGLALTFPAAFLVAATAKPQNTHPLGKAVTARHSARYINEGSSGWWEYWNSNIKWLRWFNNYEDGLLREPSGKNSAAVQGKERTFWNMVLWTWRNPFNWGKRTLPLFHCMINECKVSYIGHYVISDKVASQSGWYIVKAKHRQTKRTYYGARWVKHYPDDKVRQMYIGFKIKPEHGDIVQEPDDADKAFTFRLIPFMQTRN